MEGFTYWYRQANWKVFNRGSPIENILPTLREMYAK